MIDTSALRRGNILFYNDRGQLGNGKLVVIKDKIVIVIEVLEDGINLTEGGYTEYKDEKLSGISLTSEILEKCGFRTTVNNNSFGNGVIGLFFYKGEYIYYRAKGKYLHQLQNLYYTLTGEELNVQL